MILSAFTSTCPYLNGLSTTWILGEYRRSGDVNQKHLRIIDNFSEALSVSEKRVLVLDRSPSPPPAIFGTRSASPAGKYNAFSMICSGFPVLLLHSWDLTGGRRNGENLFTRMSANKS